MGGKSQYYNEKLKLVRFMKKLVIIGSGGHAKVVIDIIRENGDYQIEGCVSKDRIESFQGVPILGTDKCLAELINDGIKNAFIAIGDNRKRLEISKKIRAIGFSLINVISKKAIVSKSVRFGSGIIVHLGAVVNVGTIIEDLAIINTSASIGHDCSIGKASHIAPGTRVTGNVKIGNGALLGVGTVVIPNIKIGNWTVIGAGSVVIKDIPSFSVAVGNPAKVIKRISKI